MAASKKRRTTTRKYKSRKSTSPIRKRKLKLVKRRVVKAGAFAFHNQSYLTETIGTVMTVGAAFGAGHAFYKRRRGK